MKKIIVLSLLLGLSLYAKEVKELKTLANSSVKSANTHIAKSPQITLKVPVTLDAIQAGKRVKSGRASYVLTGKQYLSCMVYGEVSGDVLVTHHVPVKAGSSTVVVVFDDIPTDKLNLVTRYNCIVLYEGIQINTHRKQLLGAKSIFKESDFEVCKDEIFGLHI